MHLITLKIFLTLLISSSLSCEKRNNEITDALVTENIYALDINELSGLAIANSNILYTVSDNTNKIYKISSSGKILSSFSFTGEDLEGIALNPIDNTIYVVEERKREILQFDNLGNHIRTINVSIEKNDINSGLEGICINPLNNHIFVLNEKSPGKLIELNSSGIEIKSTDLNFASDYSGLCINPNGKEIWIISDESRKIYKCDTTGNLIKAFSVNIAEIEGISIDFTKEKIYIVSDSYKKLYQFDIPL
ncbi:MAG: hypothetical protein GY834_14880 [Bacteroidetes bacterium]|nr:hypothetical protein [Bacteroidota bacterium]